MNSTATDPFEVRPGNSLTAIESILKRKGADGVLAVRDLTGSTSVKFSVVNAASGAAVITEASATIVTPSAGLVRYSLSASSFTAAGIYHYTWREYVGAAHADYPVRPRDGVIWVHSATQTAQEAYDAAIA